MPYPRTQQANLPACSPQSPLNAKRQVEKLYTIYCNYCFLKNCRFLTCSYVNNVITGSQQLIIISSIVTSYFIVIVSATSLLFAEAMKFVTCYQLDTVKVTSYVLFAVLQQKRTPIF